MGEVGRLYAYHGDVPAEVRLLKLTGEVGEVADAFIGMLPGADCFVFGQRVVRWNFQRGDGTNPRRYTFSSDPRTIRDIVAAFELAWNRATPHADYKPD